MKLCLVKKIAGILVLILMLGVANGSSLSYNIDSGLYYVIDGSSNTQDIKITNNGNSTIYLKARPYRVLNPRQKNEKMIPESLKDLFSNKLTLYIPHKILVIAPHTDAALHVVVQGKRGRFDNFFRINIVQIPASLAVKKMDNRHKNVKTGTTSIYLNYSAIVVVRPTQNIVSLDTKKTAHSVEYINRGNTVTQCRLVWRSHGPGNNKYCTKAGACRKIFNVYPNDNKIIPLDFRDKHNLKAICHIGDKIVLSKIL